jgi:hypothetical protein
MWEDPIVAEVRRVREAYVEKYDYDLRAIYQALKAQEKSEEGEMVSFPPKLIQTSEQDTVPLRPLNAVV